jgi:hypothetical protein
MEFLAMRWKRLEKGQLHWRVGKEEDTNKEFYLGQVNSRCL